MKVWIVIGGWEYEGYAEPSGVFSSKEKANLFVASDKCYNGYDEIKVLEYEVDEERHWAEKHA